MHCPFGKVNYKMYLQIVFSFCFANFYTDNCNGLIKSFSSMIFHLRQALYHRSSSFTLQESAEMLKKKKRKDFSCTT